jgi:hypothetical protein
MTELTSFKGINRKNYKMFGIYMSSILKKEIDATRVDIPRSRWLRKAAINELERQKKEKEKLLLLQQGLCSVGAQLSHEVVAATTNQPPKVGPEGSD